MVNKPVYLLQNINFTTLVSRFIKDGATDFTTLDSLAKDELVVLAMGLIGSDGYIAIQDSNDTVLADLMRYIHAPNSDNAFRLASLMRENVIEYFEADFNTVFQELLND